MYTLLQSLPYPAHVVDDKLNVIAWNHGAECTFGPSAREALGRPCPELVRTAEPALWAQRIATLRQTGFLACRSRVLNRDGLLVVVDVLSVARQGPSGIEYVSVLRRPERHSLQIPGGPSRVLRHDGRTLSWQQANSSQVSAVVEAAMTDTDWPARIARNMRLARALTGVSQQRLADQIGAVRTQVVDWESGRRGMPSIRNLERIALALGQTVGWFYDPHDENGGPA